MKFKRSRLSNLTILTMICVMIIPYAVFADQSYMSPQKNTILSEEAKQFLKENKVDIDFDKIDKRNMNNSITVLDDEILALEESSKAYNFSSQQIKNYVNAITHSKPIYVKNKNSAKSQYRAVDRPRDNGIGYEVKSRNGYHQETAFAILPDVRRIEATSGYMMYTVSGSSSWGIDVGLWYGSRNYIHGWMGVYYDGANQVGSPIISELSAGSKVYLSALLESNGNLRVTIFDGDDFSKIYYDLVYYVYDKGINRNNGVFNRQITLCCDDKNFNNGSYLLGAKFYDAYIYNSNGYYRTLPQNTISNNCGVFGTNPSNRYKVQVNSNAYWYAAYINIRFDV